MDNQRLFIGMTVICVVLAGNMAWGATTYHWDGDDSTDWNTANNWNPNGDPVAGDTCILDHLTETNISLSGSTPMLASVEIDDRSELMFSNWDTMLRATNVTIKSGGVITCDGPFTNNTPATNRVYIQCTNLTIETGGAINVKGKGFSGGINPAVGSNYQPGHGPGGGVNDDAGGPGASYGGAGTYGDYLKLRVGTTYGSATAPLDPGSGGKAGNIKPAVGGSGGGAVRVLAGQVVVNGEINADATYGTGSTRDSGGSGGGIFIDCTTIAGTNGAITANGSRANTAGSSARGGGGGGGRIAVLYNSVAQGSVPLPSIHFSTAPGLGAMQGNSADIGTLYFTDSRLFSATNLFTGQWLAPGFTNQMSMSDLTVSNVWLRLPGFDLTVSNTLSVIGDVAKAARYKLELTNDATVSCGDIQVRGATLSLGGSGSLSGPTVSVDNDVTVTNFGTFRVNAGLANAGTAVEYGAWVNVGGDIRIASDSWIRPAAHPTNGAVVLFNMNDLTIDSGGGFDADVLGFGGGRRIPTGTPYGPGIGAQGRGGSGYGGAGAEGYGPTAGGPVYGSSNAPVDSGSGAWSGVASGSGDGPYGGGSVQIRAEGTVTVRGEITANGGNGSQTYGPGSSGGGIYIVCRKFIGDAGGLLEAKGGATWPHANGFDGGGGGGGRIAVWRFTDASLGSIPTNVAGGASGYYNPLPGDVGTVVWGWVPPSGTVILIR